MNAIRAVLFDVGGPLDTEVVFEQLVDRDIRAALEAEGVAVTEGQFETAAGKAVETFAPSAYAAIIWELAGHDPDLAERAYARFRSEEAVLARSRERGGIELRAGIPEALAELHGEGLLLGLAANQGAGILAELDRVGIGRFFTHREVAGHHGYHKPDVRLFLRACEDLGVTPAEVVMVGDRVDNDVAPARLLGMKTVLFRTGRHIAQQPRSWDEAPHAEVWDVPGMLAAVRALSTPNTEPRPWGQGAHR